MRAKVVSYCKIEHAYLIPLLLPPPKINDNIRDEIMDQLDQENGLFGFLSLLCPSLSYLSADKAINEKKTRGEVLKTTKSKTEENMNIARVHSRLSNKNKYTIQPIQS